MTWWQIACKNAKFDIPARQKRIDDFWQATLCYQLAAKHSSNLTSLDIEASKKHDYFQTAQDFA
jgi:hypothetical protein